MTNQTITELKQDLESNMKLEGFSEIYRGVILKYMDLAYTMGQRDQIAQYQTEIPEMFEGTMRNLEDLTRLKTWQEDH